MVARVDLCIEIAEVEANGEDGTMGEPVVIIVNVLPLVLGYPPYTLLKLPILLAVAIILPLNDPTHRSPTGVHWVIREISVVTPILRMGALLD